MVNTFDELKQICGPLYNIIEQAEKEIALLSQKYANTIKCGFGSMRNKYIKVDWNHILKPEFVDLIKQKGGRLTGFHHDPGNVIEKSGLIKFIDKKMGQHGCYKADVIWNGKTSIDKTFFPSEWTRDQVINKIHEAYTHFLTNGTQAKIAINGKYEIVGITREGIKIEMHMTQKGYITSAYHKLD